jgi:thiamine biosynthesis protein ThiI
VPTHLVVHYAEIALKGHNRPLFERLLVENIRRSLRGVPYGRVERVSGRILVEVTDSHRLGEMMERVQRVFGVSWYAPVELLPREFESLKKRVLERVGEEVSEGGASSFRVAVRRADKTYPYTSMQLARMLGQAVMELHGLRVSMKEPDLTVYVDILDRGALLYFRKYRGLGGLPVGSSGRALHLLSGGIDSPVAAWLLLKRGCRLTYLHFYAYPSWQEAAERKMVRLVRHLALYGGEGDLYLAPYHHFQMGVLKAPPGLELILFRRFMFRVAEELAQRLGVAAVSTGESLAQVASQTLANMTAAAHGLKVEVLRPLLTYDKEEIVGLSKRIGLYELSIQDYRDCCSILSRHPETRVSPERLLEAEAQLGLGDLVKKTLDETAKITVAREESPLLAAP